MIHVNLEKIDDCVKQLNALKTTKKAIQQNTASKGYTEQEMQQAKEALHKIDVEMDVLITSTVDLLTQTKTLFKTYDQDYVSKFARR